VASEGGIKKDRRNWSRAKGKGKPVAVGYRGKKKKEKKFNNSRLDDSEKGTKVPKPNGERSAREAQSKRKRKGDYDYEYAYYPRGTDFVRGFGARKGGKGKHASRTIG